VNKVNSTSKAPEILVEETAGLERHDEPLQMGIPLPRGWLAEGSSVSLAGEDQGGRIPVQSRPLAYWPDGSIKWLLIAFCASVPANQRVRYRLQRHTGAGIDMRTCIHTVMNGVNITVHTGFAEFKINTSTDLFFSTVTLNRDGSAPVKGLHLEALDKRQNACQLELIDHIVEEAAGEVLLRVKSRARLWQGRRKRFLNLTVRQTFYAGQAGVTIDCTVHNPDAAFHPGGYWDLGDRGSFLFRNLLLTVSLSRQSENVLYQLDADRPVAFARAAADWLIYQDSSGGQQWNSPNHIDAEGQLTVSERGYRYGVHDEVLGKTASQGLRASPWLAAAVGDTYAGCFIEDFWQNFPSALSCFDDRLVFGFFPGESGQLYELQGGEQKRHTMHLVFGTQDEVCHQLACFRKPLTVTIDPQWIERTGAISYFSPESDDRNREYLAYVSHCIQGENTFFDRQEQIDEFGWRNYGDLYADHEAVRHPADTLFISHYNNQYDFVHGALVHFLRSGDQRWQRLASALSRHVMDIDIYRTDKDKAAYNNGQFWHTDHYKEAHTATHRTYSRKMFPAGQGGGGPSNENDYASGLLLYHYLTGDPLAAETVRDMADWVINMDDGGKTLFAVFDQGPSGLASQTVSCDFHKPGRGAGNSINTLIDAYRLTGQHNYLSKAEELVQRCIHPHDDIQALELDQPEYRWSYLVFLQALGKYLDLKLELGDQGYCFHYAMQSLLHYADWMADHEKPYLDVLDRVEIPTETWPAHDIRKCHVFHLAALYACPEHEQRFAEKADFFFQRCLDDVQSFATAHLTRPLVLLVVYGTIHAYFQKNGHQLDCQVAPVRYNFGEPEPFIPQRRRFPKVFKRHAVTTVKEGARIIRERLARLKTG